MIKREAYIFAQKIDSYLACNVIAVYDSLKRPIIFFSLKNLFNIFTNSFKCLKKDNRYFKIW